MRAWIAPPDTPHQVYTYVSVYIRMCSLHNLQAGAWVPQGCRDGVVWWTGVYQHSHQAAGPAVWLQKCCQWWRGGGSGPQDACHVQFAGQCSAEFVHAPTYVVCVCKGGKACWMFVGCTISLWKCSLQNFYKDLGRDEMYIRSVP